MVSMRRTISIYPDNEVLQGCVYIISMIESPGSLKKWGLMKNILDQIQHRFIS
jgi:2-dehydropantoate 2-reductase